MAEQRYWIGFDLGGTKMLVTVFDDSLKKASQVKRKTKSPGGEFNVARIRETIEQLLMEWNGAKESVAGIGLAVPGAFDLDSGIIHSAPNLGLVNYDIKTDIEKAFGIPVSVVNDVDAGTYGEYIAGAAKKSRCVLGVFPGTGIGGGCIYKGEILRGAKSSVVEIGHMQVDSNGLLCGCGKRGCLETIASRLAIAGQAAIAAYRGQAPALYAAAGYDLSKMKSGVLSASVAAGDAVIEDILRHAARILGKGIANVVNLIAPDIILLGGGLVEAMPSLYLEEVSAAIDPAVFSAYRGTYRIVVASLGDDAVTLGAAADIRNSTSR